MTLSNSADHQYAGLVGLLETPQSEEARALTHFNAHRQTETCHECRKGRALFQKKLWCFDGTDPYHTGDSHA